MLPYLLHLATRPACLLAAGLLLCPAPAALRAQGSNIGVPFTVNFPSAAYRGGAQNYAVAQDSQGVLYFANEKGMLEFDGHRWQCHPVRNKTKLRALRHGPGGRIYAGAQGDLGYFHPGPQGLWAYTSIVDQLPPQHRHVADVWDITAQGEAMLFRCSDKLLRYAAGRFEVLAHGPHAFYDFLGQTPDGLVVNERGRGLCWLRQDSLLPIPGGGQLAPHRVMAAFPHRAGTLVATLKDGFYALQGGTLQKWPTPYDDFLRRHWMNDAIALPDGGIAIGTHDNGILVVDAAGTPRYCLTTRNGLQNNTVVTLELDQAQNLWAGLNNGIDFVAHSAPFARILPDPENASTGFSSILSGGKLYLATNNGLYCRPWKPYYPPLRQGGFEAVAGTQGQAWQLMQAEGTLLMGHHEGTFVIRDNTAVKIPGTAESWQVQPLEGTPGYLLAGTYTGLELLRPGGPAGWQRLRPLPGFHASSRICAQQPDGTIWITHDYQGAYRLRLTPDLQRVAEVRHYAQAAGFPSELDVNVFHVFGELVFTSEAGIFRHNPTTDRFEPYPEYNQLLSPQARIRRLVPDAQGNLWFVRNDEVGYLRRTGTALQPAFQPVAIPELRGMVVENFEHINPLDSQNVIIAAKQGFVLFDPTHYHDAGPPCRVYIRAVHGLGPQDTVLYAGNLAQAPSPTFPPHMRAFRFLCASPMVSVGAAMQYSYFLEGLDKTWSDWTDKPEKDYTNLPPGRFVFRVRARNPQGRLSESATFAFRIPTPWYLTPLAKATYALLAAAALAGMMWLVRHRHEREKRLLRLRQARAMHLREQAFKLEAERTEKELLRLRNEALQYEIAHKNRELASAAMHLVQKGAILSDLKDALKDVGSATDQAPVKQEVKRIIRKIDQDSRMDQDWTQFAFHFDQVHSGFLKALKDAHPQLTQNDLKLCAYLRMGLSSKEIAGLMNVSVRGTEISRYRLRKKLGIGHEVVLADFLSAYTPPPPAP